MPDYFFDYLECDKFEGAERYAECLARKTAEFLREIADTLEESPDTHGLLQAEKDLKSLLKDLSPHLYTLENPEYHEYLKQRGEAEGRGVV